MYETQRRRCHECRLLDTHLIEGGLHGSDRTAQGLASMSLFEYMPHPHVAGRAKQGPVKVADQHPQGTGFARLNTWVAVRITAIVGTMVCAYLFMALTLVSLPSALSSGNLLIIIAWIAQTFLQLVLLPIIIVGQNVQAAAADARSQATYDDASAVLEEAKQIQAHLQAQDAAIQQILTHVSGTR